MKRILLTILVGSCVSVAFGLTVPIPYIFVLIFILGILSGYVAQQKGAIAGAIVGASMHLVPVIAILIAGVVLHFIIHATWDGDAISAVNQLLNPVLYSIVDAGLGGFGGALGEYLYHKTKPV